jgi:adenosylcobinamide kinase/adenosylcobinamide-phosphate guanylyltransferase
MLTLVIGGARSGKSQFAQSLCAQAVRVAYIATALADDDEMRNRIARHRTARPAGWLTVEEPLALAEAIARIAPESDVVVIDCLTVWLSNFCWHHREVPPEALEECTLATVDRLISASAAGAVIAVSNEVGCGIVPENSLGRLFRDLQGIVNQRVARAAETVYHLVAGIPTRIKS